MVKNKPSISVKLASARKTGGGPAEAILIEFEWKIKAIKGVETYEGTEFPLEVGSKSKVTSPSSKPTHFPIVSYVGYKFYVRLPLLPLFPPHGFVLPG